MARRRWRAAGRVSRGHTPLSDFRSPATFAVDWRAVAFVLALVIGYPALVGMFPVLHLKRGKLVDRLRGGATMLAHGVAERRTRDTLATIQLALAIAVLIGAGLLIQSLARDVGRSAWLRSGCCLRSRFTAGSPLRRARPGRGPLQANPGRDGRRAVRRGKRRRPEERSSRRRSRRKVKRAPSRRRRRSIIRCRRATSR